MMVQSMRLLLIQSIICMVSVIGIIGSTIAEPAEPTREQLQLQISIMQDYIKKLETDLKTRANSADPVLEKAYIETRKKEYEYLTAIMDVNIGAFRAQRFASGVILFLVVLVVTAGTAFAGFQLWKSVSVAGVQQSSDLEVSASKVRVTSSVVGVVVLTISLVFLYIYAQEIYHTRVISTSQGPAGSK
jgi:hypothetical protein